MNAKQNPLDFLRTKGLMILLLVAIPACGGGGGGSGGGSGNSGSPVLRSITLDSATLPATVQVGLNHPFLANGNYSDGTSQDMTGTVTWASSDPAIATVGADGISTGVSAGVVTITADGGGVQGAATLTVEAPVLQTILVMPGVVSLAKGVTTQLQAIAAYSNGTSVDITTAALWGSSDGLTAPVSAAGGVTALAVGGPVTVNAQFSGLSAGSRVTVTGAVVRSIGVSPPAASVAALAAGGLPVQFTATAVYSDGSLKDVTGQAAWTSSAPPIAAVNTTGVATGQLAGYAVISADFGGVSSLTSQESALFTVTQAVLQSLSITPAGAVLPLGPTLQMKAAGGYSDGTTADLTPWVVWSVGDPALASITPGGKVQGVAPGVVAVTAAHPAAGVSFSTDVTIVAARLETITVTPQTAGVAKGLTLLLTATGSYSDGSTADISTGVSWTSSNPALAVVNGTGLVTGVLDNPAPVAITAADGSGIAASALVTVTPPSIVKIGVSPGRARIRLSRSPTKKLTAIAVLSDGSTRDITVAPATLWTSSNPAAVSVSGGLVTANATGSAVVTAQDGPSGVISRQVKISVTR